ncbi:hypothetical protein HYT24_02145 [Candidatus Pacearchaeota archaeon]|nr:hypothetical protein [Candidatus Pacearchaeota archaeon]
MAERNRRRALQKLEEIGASEHIEFMFKDGSVRQGYLYDVDQAELYYTTTPVTSDSFGEGSKVDPRDYLPNIPLHDLGYVLSLTTGRKISLMPFHS